MLVGVESCMTHHQVLLSAAHVQLCLVGQRRRLPPFMAFEIDDR